MGTAVNSVEANAVPKNHKAKFRDSGSTEEAHLPHLLESPCDPMSCNNLTNRFACVCVCVFPLCRLVKKERRYKQVSIIFITDVTENDS